MKFTHTSRETAAALRTSESTLRRLRQAGVLRPGIHYIGTGTGTKAPALLWSPDAVMESLAKRSRQTLAT